MILDMQGGFRTEERGGVEMKVNKLHYLQIYLAMKQLLLFFFAFFTGKRFDANILAA